jgi:hypothetical protein
MGKARVGVYVTITALVLAGCVSRVGGPAEEPLALPLAPNPGDQLNLCSLTGPAAFEPAGIARMPGKPDLEGCQVPVATDDGKVFIRLGIQARVAALPEDRTVVAELGRGATVERYSEMCDMALVLPRGIAITAHAVPSEDERLGNELLCELTEGAATGMFNVLAGGRAKFWSPEPNSLATVDACEVLRAEAVYRQLEVNGEIERFPGGHTCWWGGEDDSAILRFPVAETPVEIGVPPGTPSEVIAGRESWVVEELSACTVFTRHIEFGPGVGTFEFATLSATTSGACGPARALAAQAWAQLPT